MPCWSCSPPSTPQNSHSEPPRSEACVFVIDASAGCQTGTACTLRVALSGSTEQDYDYLSVWRVTDRSAPAASLSNNANQVRR